MLQTITIKHEIEIDSEEDIEVLEMIVQDYFKDLIESKRPALDKLLNS